MRKEKIYNHYIANNHGNQLIYNALSGMLRRKPCGDVYENELANPIARKKLTPQSRSNDWVSEEATSIVVIDDSRQEVANVAQRGLITTSMIFNDILQCNKGRQNYENERNRFFIQDDSANYRYITGISALGVLDVIWYMREQGIDALEVLKEETDDREHKILSQRYNNIIADFRNANYDEVLEITKSAFDNYYATVIAEPDNKGLEIDHDDFDAHSYDGWGDYNYSPVQEIGDRYFRIMRNAKRANIEPISFEKHFEQEVNACKLKGSMRFLLAHLAEKLGYVKDSTDELNLPERFFKIRHYGWRTIAKSAFKRNTDYRANESNVVKCEVLNLRSKFMESNNG